MAQSFADAAPATDPTASLPAALVDALSKVVGSYNQANQSAQALSTAQATLAKAQSDLQNAQGQASKDAQQLDADRKALEALEDSYFQVGGSLPAPAPKPA